MKVKVCGMRDVENVRQLAELPVDYMGFIFYENSARFVNNQVHPDILQLLENKKIKKVGVFVNSKLEELKKIALSNKLDVIQCHGDESPEYCAILKEAGFIVFKAFRVGQHFDFNILEKYTDSCNYFLFDTDTKNYGGSGQKFDWSIFKKYNYEKPIILSGGIGPGDEAAINAINITNLHAIDLNSKFEINPALKDVEKIDMFLKNLRA